ncbi:hypothetical protein E2C01_064012 [Portunus trituberculatus]|uniref:Uncharacterized protein n=1 Tax=Portunus trituberculatus TaxID=210409 RepID=A0A5B7HAM8_PORTR|nr:hypothetical protein [Portunus trituberculatus]
MCPGHGPNYNLIVRASPLASCEAASHQGPWSHVWAVLQQPVAAFQMLLLCPLTSTGREGELRRRLVLGSSKAFTLRPLTAAAASAASTTASNHASWCQHLLCGNSEAK